MNSIPTITGSSNSSQFFEEQLQAQPPGSQTTNEVALPVLQRDQRGSESQFHCLSEKLGVTQGSPIHVPQVAAPDDVVLHAQKSRCAEMK